MALITAVREKGFDSVRDLWLRTGLPRATIERLADGDAFRSIGLSRRDALWAARALEKKGRVEDLPLFAVSAASDFQEEADASLPPMLPGEEVIQDYRFLSLSLRAHPAQFVRCNLAQDGVRPAEVLARPEQNGRPARVAGLVLVRQRPGSAKGVIFMTLEDETGIANVIVWPKTFEKYRSIVMGARFIEVRGRVQSEDGVVHLVANSLHDRTHLLTEMAEGDADFDVLDRADEVKRPSVDLRTVVKPRSRLARLIEEAPELTGDVSKILDQNRTVVAALAAHRAAAARISAKGADGPAETAPAPVSTWGTARSASNDVAKLGRSRRRKVAGALPRGRNFH